MDLDGILVGGLLGLIAGALIFTSTGREVSGAVGSRAAHHIRPSNGKRR